MSEPIPLRDEHSPLGLVGTRQRERERERLKACSVEGEKEKKKEKSHDDFGCVAGARPCLAEEARSQLRVLCFRIQFVVIAAPEPRPESGNARLFIPGRLVFARVCFTPASASASGRFYFPLSPSGDTRFLSPSTGVRPSLSLSLSLSLSHRPLSRLSIGAVHATAEARDPRPSRGPRDFDVRKTNEIASSLTHLPRRSLSRLCWARVCRQRGMGVLGCWGPGVVSRIARGVDNLRIYYREATGTVRGE